MIGNTVRLLVEGLRQRREGRPSLTELAQRFGTDKWSEYHRYTPHYERHFAPFRDAPITLIEIGVGGYGLEEDGGSSLRMWKSFFPKARIYGIDIADKSIFEEERIRIFRGSQVDERFLMDVLAETGPPTLVIDDGSHINDLTIRTFEILYPHLLDGGVYAIEDMQTAYWPQFGGRLPWQSGPRTSMDFVKERLDGLNHAEYRWAGYEPTPIDLGVVAIHCYNSLVFFEKGHNDPKSVSYKFAKPTP